VFTFEGFLPCVGLGVSQQCRVEAERAVAVVAIKRLLSLVQVFVGDQQSHGSELLAADQTQIGLVIRQIMRQPLVLECIFFTEECHTTVLTLHMTHVGFPRQMTLLVNLQMILSHKSFVTFSANMNLLILVLLLMLLQVSFSDKCTRAHETDEHVQLLVLRKCHLVIKIYVTIDTLVGFLSYLVHTFLMPLHSMFGGELLLADFTQMTRLHNLLLLLQRIDEAM